MAGRDEMMMRQRALADFGDFVLDHEGLDEILNEGCRLVAVALGADLAKVIEIERETETGLVRAGVGWRPGVVGRERVSLTERSSEAFAIEQAEPVITNDILREDRFEFPPFLRDHGVIALVNVPILLPGRRPWGILQVDAREPREFDQNDIEFLKTYAMVLGPVIDRLRDATERKRVEAALRESEERRAFLLMLSDRLRAEVDARAIAATSLDLLADHLRLDRAYVAQVDKGRDLAEIGPEHRRADLGPVEGVLALSEFPAAFAQVERTTLVLADTTADPTLSDLDRQGFAKLRMGALIVAAARKGARNPVWSLLVAMEEPRVWTAAEVALVEEVAERTWAAIERNRAVERQKLLLAELQHRVRNILAMVRSVVRRTVRSGDSAEDIADHLDGRLSSLARTQVMLTRAAAAGVDLEDLIREELLAQQADESAISVSGPAIELAPKAAEVLTLAIHELATNAVKYGALAHVGASLEVRWWVEADDDGRDRLRLLWQERGARVISAQPRRSGFGTELVQKRVPYELKGRGEIEFRPGGIRVEISFPLVHGESILATGLPRSFSREGDDA